MCDVLKQFNITDYELRSCKVSRSEDYRDVLDNNLDFPTYYQVMFPEGNIGRDFELIDFELVVTEKAKKIIESLSCENTTFVALM